MSYPGYPPAPGYGAPAPPPAVTKTKVVQCGCDEQPIMLQKSRCVYFGCLSIFFCFCCKEPIYECPRCNKRFPDVCYVPCS